MVNFGLALKEAPPGEPVHDRGARAVKTRELKADLSRRRWRRSAGSDTPARPGSRTRKLTSCSPHWGGRTEDQGQRPYCDGTSSSGQELLCISISYNNRYFPLAAEVFVFTVEGGFRWTRVVFLYASDKCSYSQCCGSWAVRIRIILPDPFLGVLGSEWSVSYSNENNKINWKGKFNKVFFLVGSWWTYKEYHLKMYQSTLGTLSLRNCKDPDRDQTVGSVSTNWKAWSRSKWKAGSGSGSKWMAEFGSVSTWSGSVTLVVPVGCTQHLQDGFLPCPRWCFFPSTSTASLLHALCEFPSCPLRASSIPSTSFPMFCASFFHA